MMACAVTSVLVNHFHALDREVETAEITKAVFHFELKVEERHVLLDQHERHPFGDLGFVTMRQHQGVLVRQIDARRPLRADVDHIASPHQHLAGPRCCEERCHQTASHDISNESIHHEGGQRIEQLARAVKELIDMAQLIDAEGRLIEAPAQVPLGAECGPTVGPPLVNCLTQIPSL